VTTSTGTATTRTDASVSLYAKLVSIMDEVGAVEKTGYNSFHKYYYLKEEDIINAVRPLLAKYGVAMIPTVLEETLGETHGSDRNGNPRTEFLCRLKVQFRFVDIENPIDSVSVVTVGHGTDPSDKSAYKALTGALKYCLRQLFMISEGGDDPENDDRHQGYGGPYGNDVPSVQITASQVAGVERGGRNRYANQVQIDELRRLAKDQGVSLAGMATLIATINGDEVDISDPATAGMQLQHYFTTSDASKIGALIQALMDRQARTAAPSFEELPPEDPDDGLPDIPNPPEIYP
jgi:hypothetical protein